MLYAAGAALSERESHAKTAGTWNLFHQQFVEAGPFDADLLAMAREVQPEREDADYDAWAVPRDEAERVIGLAATFLAAIEDLLAQLES